MNWLMIFVGGGIGSVLRFALTIPFKSVATFFPWPTLIANFVATALIGALYFSGMRATSGSIWFFSAVGFSGGLSTFSTFSLETFRLFSSGHTFYAWVNILLSIACCLLIVFLFSKMVVTVSQ